MELLPLIPLIGFALSWQRWQNTTAAAAMLHSVSTMLLVLFIGSLVGLLLPTTVLLMVLGTIFAAVEGIRCVRQHRTLPVPMAIFVILSIAYWATQIGSQYFFYDEYSHWGVFLKEMLARNQLWGADTNSMHPGYLPGTSLWQYFFAVFSRHPEGAAYLAQFSLLLTPFLVLWEKVDWRQIHWHVGILALIIITVTNFGHGLTSLYVDHLLGAWFVGVILNFLIEMKNRSTWQLTSYLLPLAVIALVKSTGVFFALACAGTITLLLAFHPDLAATRRWAGPQLWRVACFPVATAVICSLILFSWSVNRNSVSVDDTSGSTGYVASRLVVLESSFDARQQAELTRRFIDVILHQQISKDELSRQYNAFSYQLMPLYTERFRLTTVSLLGLSLIAMLLLWRTLIPPDSRRSWAIAAAGTWLTAVAYVGALYLGYRYITSDTNGYEMSSYIRYAHSMLLPVIVFCFASLVPAFAGESALRLKLAGKFEVGRNTVAFFLALGALFLFERPYLEPVYTSQKAPEFRTQLDSYTEQLRARIGESRLWVFYANNESNGLAGQILQFQLSPGRVHVEHDTTVILNNHKALRSELKNWEYVWYIAGNSDLDAAFEEVIGRKITERVYRIDTSGGDIVFEPVENAFIDN